MAYVYFLVLCAVWGSNFMLMKEAGHSFGPFAIGAIRVAGGAAIVAVFWFMRGGRWPLDKEHIRPMLLIVLLGYIWPFTIQPYLISKYGGGFIGQMVCFVPLATIVVSVPMLQIWPTPRQAIGVIGGLICMMIIMFDGTARNVAPLDLALAVSVPIAYTICNTYIKKRFVGLSPLALGFSALAITTVALGPVAIGMAASGQFPAEEVRLGDHFWMALGAVLFLGTVGTGISQVLFLKLLQDHGPLFAGMVTYLIPTIAVCWGWLQGEQVTNLQLTALAGALLMVGLVQYGAAAPKEPVVAEELA